MTCQPVSHPLASAFNWLDFRAGHHQPRAKMPMRCLASSKLSEAIEGRSVKFRVQPFILRIQRQRKAGTLNCAAHK